MNPGVTFLLIGLLSVASILPARPSLARSVLVQAPETPQDEARDAVRRDGVKPFSEIMAIALKRVAGDFVKIELKRKHDRWEYKVRILAPEGRRYELKIDAVSGEILEVE
jgi:uncharacterized membrane protein YkoI